MIAAPPLEAGAVHERFTRPLTGTPDATPGAPGAVGGGSSLTTLNESSTKLVGSNTDAARTVITAVPDLSGLCSSCRFVPPEPERKLAATSVGSLLVTEYTSSPTRLIDGSVTNWPGCTMSGLGIGLGTSRSGTSSKALP